MVKVLVRDNNVEQALRVAKRKSQKEGLYREMKERQRYEKPTTKSVKKKISTKPATKRAPVKRASTKKRVVAHRTDVKPVSAKKNDSVKYTNMFAAFRAFWRRGFIEWTGTSSRSEYWWSWLANILVCVLFAFLIMCSVFLDAELFKDTAPIAPFTTVVMACAFLYVIAAIIPAISMLTRRMHDAGLSAWYWVLYLTSFIPWIGSYIWTISMFVIALLPTKITDNPYHKYNK